MEESCAIPSSAKLMEGQEEEEEDCLMIDIVISILIGPMLLEKMSTELLQRQTLRSIDSSIDSVLVGRTNWYRPYLDAL